MDFTLLPIIINIANFSLISTLNHVCLKQYWAGIRWWSSGLNTSLNCKEHEFHTWPGN